MNLKDLIERAKESEIVDWLIELGKEELEEAQAEVEAAAREEVVVQSQEMTRKILIALGVIGVLLLVRRDR